MTLTLQSGRDMVIGSVRVIYLPETRQPMIHIVEQKLQDLLQKYENTTMQITQMSFQYTIVIYKHVHV